MEYRAEGYRKLTDEYTDEEIIIIDDFECQDSYAVCFTLLDPYHSAPAPGARYRKTSFLIQHRLAIITAPNQ